MANPNVSGTDHFVYTIKDGDGNTSTTTLNITVNASGLAAGPDTVTVNEAGLASGSLHDGSNVTPSGTTLVGLVSGGVGADTYSLVGSATGTHGTIVINSDGTFTYTLTSPILTGTPTELADTFTYQVKDSVGNTITNTITVNALDDHPTATPDTNSLTSGQTVTSNVESNDVFGADGKSGGVNGGVVGVATGTDTATALSTGVGAALTGSLGTLTLQANGSYSYVANPNVSGTDHFVYTIKDGDGNTSTTTLNITVNASGLAAGPDTVTVNEAGLASGSLHDGSNVTPSGTTLVGLVSGGVGADTYSLVGSATGTHGTIVINSDGTFTYTLTSPILAGTPTELADTFTYQVKDSVGNTITNTITVNALDDHPTATPDTNSLTSGQTVTSNVESNDVFGADGKSGGVNGGVVGVATGTDTATALSTGVGAALTGSLGTLTLQANGSYSYVANPNVSGTDHFVYTIKDGDGNTSTTTLNITVNASGLAAGPDTVTVNEAGLASGSLHDGSNVTPSGTTLVGLVSGGVGADTYSLVGSATGTHGTIVINSDGTFTYTLTSPILAGTPTELADTFTYQVKDSVGNTITNTITVNALDDHPTATPDTNSLTSGQTVTSNVESNDVFGADGKSGGVNGGVVGVATGTNTATALSTGVGAALTGSLGTLTLQANGSYSYVANPNVSGTDHFVYTIKDGDGNTSTTTLNITVNASGLAAGPDTVTVNEAGLASGSLHDGSNVTPSGTTLVGLVSGGVGADTYSLVGSATGTHGTIVINSDGTFTYTLTSPILTGTPTELADTFTYQVKDSVGNTITNTITVNALDDHPTATPDTNSLTSGQTVTSNVESNDVFGADGKSGGVNGGVVGVATGTDTATALSTGVGAALTGSLGTLTLQANGSYSYVANPNVSGTDHFVYTIKDGDGNTSTTTLNITVNASGLAAGPDTVTVNEAGLASGSLHDGSNVTPSGTTLVGLVSGGVGADTYSLVGSATGTHGTIVINSDGTFTYTLTSPILTGTPTELADTFTYQVKDSVGNTITNTITVNALDDVPQILSIQNAVMPNVSNTDAHGSWQPVFGADGLSSTAIGIAMGTAPAGETYSFSNNVGTSASSEQINKVTVTPTTGAAYTFYEYTHYDATTHSSEMFAYQTLAGAQSGLASDQFFTLTMATDGTYDFHLASNQLQASVSTDLTSISAGHSGWAEVNGTTSSTGSGTRRPATIF
ncbi:beta strand repeat-containing protein [Mesorhizobium sp. ORM6]